MIVIVLGLPRFWEELFCGTACKTIGCRIPELRPFAKGASFKADVFRSGKGQGVCRNVGKNGGSPPAKKEFGARCKFP